MKLKDSLLVVVAFSLPWKRDGIFFQFGSGQNLTQSSKAAAEPPSRDIGYQLQMQVQRDIKGKSIHPHDVSGREKSLLLHSKGLMVKEACIGNGHSYT